MTWKHLAGLAVAVVLVLGCGLSSNCTSNEHIQTAIISLGNTIASGIIGNAMGQSKAA